MATYVPSRGQIPTEGTETATDFPESCACADLLTNAACLRDPNMNKDLRKAIQVVLLNAIIAGLNSSEVYSLEELLDLGKCCSCEQYQEFERDAMWTYILWALAVRVGSTSDTPGELIDEACKLNCGLKNLDGIYIALLCRFAQEVDDLANPQ